MQSFFFHRWDLVCRPRVPSEDRGKNRDDFHCMEMSLVMRMLFIFGDDRKGACKFGNEVIFLEWRLLIFV